MAQRIMNIADYFQADRRGRAVRLDRNLRETVWNVCAAYAKEMRQRGKIDIIWASNALTNVIEKGGLPSEALYDSIIVDEIQDFGSAQFRLLRALAGKEHPDDMFLTGDPRQRIYAIPQVVLAQCGINVRGRAHQLVMNYRTTGPILKWANRLLSGTHMDDLDGGQGDTDPSISAFAGEMPKLIQHATPEQEQAAVAQEIRHLLQRGVQPSEIAVIARHHDDLKAFVEVLERNGIPTNYVKSAQNSDGVSLVTMHGCKGLEYSYVFIVSVNVPAEEKKPEPAGNENEAQERHLAETRLLHVAITRARKAVQVSYSGTPMYTLQRFLQV